MQCEVIAMEDSPAALAAELRALIPAPEMVQTVVSEIVAEVRAHGDEALNDYTRRFDTAGAEPPPLRVTNGELQQAAAQLDPAVRAGLEQAIENVRRVAEAAHRADATV